MLPAADMARVQRSLTGGIMFKILMNKKLPLIASVCLAAVIVCGCAVNQKTAGAGTAAADPKDARLKVVTTTTMLADLTGRIGGDAVDVRGLMGPGIDPHLYQASAGDVTSMQEADVVVYNGLHLEGKMGDIFASLKGQGRLVICVEDGIDTALLLADENNPEIYDPHIWFDAAIWMAAAKHVAAGLETADPDHGAAYRENLAGCLAELEELDGYIRARVEELPAKQRVLITAHDAFRYFGKAYGFQVMGLQGISTDAEAGTADVSNLAAFIAGNRIKAVFVESSVPPKNIEALRAAVKARGFETAIGGELYSDSLGDKTSGADTYILTCKRNIDTIVDALK